MYSHLTKSYFLWFPSPTPWHFQLKCCDTSPSLQQGLVSPGRSAIRARRRKRCKWCVRSFAPSAPSNITTPARDVESMSLNQHCLWCASSPCRYSDGSVDSPLPMTTRTSMMSSGGNVEAPSFMLAQHWGTECGNNWVKKPNIFGTGG